ncbi:MAG: hypothetical protein ACR2FS_18740, partial [Phormidesmis sp.]
MAWLLALGLSHPPAVAQISIGGGGGSPQSAISWVRLDGYKVFQLAAPQAAIGSRIRRVETNLEQIRDRYVQADSDELRFTTERIGPDELPAIFINGRYLLTLTKTDANMQGTLPWSLAEDLRQQEIAAVLIALAAAVAIGVIEYRQRRLPDRYGLAGLLLRIDPSGLEPQQQEHLQEARRRSLQLIEIIIAVGTALLILWLFPMTRPFCLSAINWLKIPFVIVVLLAIAYIGARLSFALIESLSSGLVNESLSAIENSRRTELRVSTIT